MVNDTQNNDRGLLDDAQPPWRAGRRGEERTEERERRETGVLTNAGQAPLPVCLEGIEAD